MIPLIAVALAGLWALVLVDLCDRARENAARPPQMTAEDVGAWLAALGAAIAPASPPEVAVGADPAPPARRLQETRPPIELGAPHIVRRCYGSGRFVPPWAWGDRVAVCGVCGGLTDLVEAWPGGRRVVADHRPPNDDPGPVGDGQVDVDEGQADVDDAAGVEVDQPAAAA